MRSLQINSITIITLLIGQILRVRTLELYGEIQQSNGLDIKTQYLTRKRRRWMPMRNRRHTSRNCERRQDDGGSTVAGYPG